MQRRRPLYATQPRMRSPPTTRIPLVDSVAHPTLDGRWRGGGSARFTFERLLSEMDDAGVAAAVCVGMKGIGGYEETQYARACASRGGDLYPVAFFDFDHVRSAADVDEYLGALR